MKKLKHVVNGLIVVAVFALGWGIGFQQLAQMQAADTSQNASPRPTSPEATGDADDLPCTVRVWYSAWNTPSELKSLMVEVLEESGRKVVESPKMADGMDVTVYWIDGTEAAMSDSSNPTSLRVGSISDKTALQNTLAERLGGCENTGAE